MKYSKSFFKLVPQHTPKGKKIWIGFYPEGSKNAEKKIDMGFESDLLAKKANFREIFKNQLYNYQPNDSYDKIKTELLNSLEEKKQFREKSVSTGHNFINKIIDKYQLISDFKPTRQKSWEEIVKYLISKRISEPSSILNAFENKDSFNEDLDVSKNSFYRSLDLVYENADVFLNKINKMVEDTTNRKNSPVFFDSSTFYFETFSRKHLKSNGYSKDGKVKEDQIVIGMACDQNGIPFHIKLFKGNTADQSTLITFILDMEKKYNIKNITIVADRGMSSAGNIRFLEQKGYKFIISYRAKAATKGFKDYVLDETDYTIVSEDFKYKEQRFFSSYKNGRITTDTRRRIITFSRKRASKDRNNRNEIINDFKRKLDKNGMMNPKRLLNSKKAKFFQETSHLKFEIDPQKIENDEKYDGLFVYETNLLDAPVQDIVELYSRQWKIEEGFRTLKGFLEIRPAFLQTEEHIIAHALICFASLVILKLSLHLINTTAGYPKNVSESKLRKIIKKVKDVYKVNLITGRKEYLCFDERSIDLEEELLYKEFMEILSKVLL